MRIHTLLLAGSLAVTTTIQAQNIAINSSGAAPVPSAMLDVSSTTSGMLIPRMNETQRLAIASPATGLLVFQTNATSPIPANQFWYYDGTAWRPLFTDRIGWSIWGNTGTNANNNFLGTTDNIAVRVRTNNTQRFEFTTGGELRSFSAGAANAPTYSWTTNAVSGIYQPANNTIGLSTNSTERFRIPNANQVHAMANGTAAAPFYSWNTNTNTGMFQQAATVIGFSTNGTERFRIPAANQVHAVSNGTAAAPFYSWSANTGTGMFQQTANVLGFSTNGTERFRIPNSYQVHALNNGTAAAPFYSWSTNTGTGMFQAGANLLAFSTASAERMRIAADGRVAIAAVPPTNRRLSVVGLTGDLSAIFATNSIYPGFAVWGTHGNNSGTGIAAMGQNVATGTTYLVNGSGGAFSGYDVGLYSHTDYFLDASGMIIQDVLTAQWNIGGWDLVNGYFKIMGPGIVSTVVKNEHDERVVLVCPEAPEALFQDQGSGQLVNGRASITLDPTLTMNLRVDEEHPLRVLIQPEGPCNGVYVTNKTATGFEVVEQLDGTSNIPFTWFISANRANETYTGPAGTREADYTGRFKPAPPIKERATVKEDGLTRVATRDQ